MYHADSITTERIWVNIRQSFFLNIFKIIFNWCPFINDHMCPQWFCICEFIFFSFLLSINYRNHKMLHEMCHLFLVLIFKTEKYKKHWRNYNWKVSRQLIDQKESTGLCVYVHMFECVCWSTDLVLRGKNDWKIL